jgi:hypothetical protein
MTKPSIKKLLNEILSDDLEQVYVQITNKAVEWVAAGFLEEANNLLEQLWSFNISHSKNVWLQDEALQIIWELSGKQPKNIPFTFKLTSEIEEENWVRNFYPGWHKSYTDQFIHKPIHQLQGQQLYVKAIISVADGSKKPGSSVRSITKIY